MIFNFASFLFFYVTDDIYIVRWFKCVHEPQHGLNWKLLPWFPCWAITHVMHDHLNKGMWGSFSHPTSFAKERKKGCFQKNVGDMFWYLYTLSILCNAKWLSYFEGPCKGPNLKGYYFLIPPGSWLQIPGPPKVGHNPITTKGTLRLVMVSPLSMISPAFWALASSLEIYIVWIWCIF